MVRWCRARRAAWRSLPTRRERGAAALEFALIAPLFFMVIFGGIEMGLMFRSNLTINDVARSSARVASIQRDNPAADRAILDRIHTRSGSLNGTVTRIVIFKADTLASELPATCRTGGSVADICNVYVPVAAGGTHDLPTIIAATGTTGLETAYGPDDRGQLTNVGVYIQYEYDYVTGFFDKTTLSATSVEVIELDL